MSQDLTLDVVVASHNPAKHAAVERAFAATRPGAVLSIRGVSVPSGVSDQPSTDEETRAGAWNRARAACDSVPEADVWVGLEGGLERFDGAWYGSAWMVVIDRHGRSGQARTPTLPLPPSVGRLLDEGLELGDANDQVFKTHNSKQGGGAYGLLTEGRMTRGGIYAQALELALLPLNHDLWQSHEAPVSDT
ncbi:MAG: inosine/xanthosine triphosphatase [Pseudomonadota bacterium]